MLLSQDSGTDKAHGATWMTHLGHLVGQSAVCGFEIGTFEGQSALWMLEHVFTHPDSRYYCIDPFTGSKDHEAFGIDCSHTYDTARKTLSPFTRCFIEKARSQDILPEWIRKGVKFDFAYVDGSHQAEDVMVDSILSFKLLKVGGILCWDDYQWKEFTDAHDCPKLSVDTFLDIWGPKLTVLHKGWQVIARKDRE